MKVLAEIERRQKYVKKTNVISNDISINFPSWNDNILNKGQ